MTINGCEYGFYYSVGAHIDYEDFIIKHPEVGQIRANVELACIMNREYNKANGIKGKELRPEDLRKLPNAVLTELMDQVNAQMKLDNEVSVETKPAKKESAAGKEN